MVKGAVGKPNVIPDAPLTNDVEGELAEAYPITGRSYELKHIAEAENVVMVELIERYPDPKSGFLYQTPLVLVLEMEGGKMKTGRHYCDPQISHETLTEDQLERAYSGTPTKRVIG